MYDLLHTESYIIKLIINFEIIDFQYLITIMPRLQFLLFLIIEKARKFQRKIAYLVF